jgi:hypothetical protein
MTEDAQNYKLYIIFSTGVLRGLEVTNVPKKTPAQVSNLRRGYRVDFSLNIHASGLATSTKPVVIISTVGKP